jgi:hypothetical protein
MSLGLKAHAKGVVKAERKFNSNRACAKLRGRVIAHKGVPMTKARVLRSPVIGKPCAVSRTERIANRVGRSSGHMTPRRTTYPDPKGKGNKSMSVKRETIEDV